MVRAPVVPFYKASTAPSAMKVLLRYRFNFNHPPQHVNQKIVAPHPLDRPLPQPGNDFCRPGKYVDNSRRRTQYR